MAIQNVEALVEKYILLDSLLFKIITTPEKETALLAIPENCADKINLISCQSVCRTPRCLLKHTLQSMISFSFQM